MPGLQSVQSGEVTLSVAEEGDPQRPTVVFIHGYPDTKAVWDPVRSRLSAEFHTVAYDVRGAGGSTAPRRAAAYDLELLGDDLLEVLGATAPGRRAHLVGHDWGGLQGWEFATLPRFAGRLASFTAVAAPSLDQVAIAGHQLRRRPLAALARAWRSWYILVLLTPGGPQLTWRVVITENRWRGELRRQGVPPQADTPRPTLASDGIHGANLYRRNIPRRLVSPRRDAFAHVPVQLIIPTRDRYIPVEHYEAAASYVSRLQRHELDATHWLPLTHPAAVAELIRGFVTAIEAES
jgi:pimeloyl-ACP methyl ester carboxylesterase